VFEADNGEVVGATPIRRLVPVEAYLKVQKRYAHLFKPTRRDDVIAQLQAVADRNIRRFGLLDPAAEREKPLEAPR
jgi:pyruvate ferredoxin oxidoreductase beta subunit